MLGIDPGTASTGYGVLAGSGDDIRLIDWGCIETEARAAPAQRLWKIYEELCGIMLAYRPDVVAVEELFFHRNARTALAVGQGRGVVLLAAAQRGVEVLEYTPLEVKQAVAGYGRASKEQVQRMVAASLGLGEAPQPDDAADAVAVALCCLRSYEFEKKTGLREDGK